MKHQPSESSFRHGFNKHFYLFLFAHQLRIATYCLICLYFGWHPGKGLHVVCHRGLVPTTVPIAYLLLSELQKADCRNEVCIYSAIYSINYNFQWSVCVCVCVYVTMYCFSHGEWLLCVLALCTIGIPQLDEGEDVEDCQSASTKMEVPGKVS